MKVAVQDRGNRAFVECLATIERVEDVLDLVAACAEHRTNRLLIDRECLPAVFFDLSSRFAGEVVQKLQNYGIRTAAVVPAEPTHSRRFAEFLSESRRGRKFRTFAEREGAERWLCAE